MARSSGVGYWWLKLVVVPHIDHANDPNDPGDIEVDDDTDNLDNLLMIDIMTTNELWEQHQKFDDQLMLIWYLYMSCENRSSIIKEFSKPCTWWWSLCLPAGCRDFATHSLSSGNLMVLQNFFLVLTFTFALIILVLTINLLEKSKLVSSLLFNSHISSAW